MKNVFLMAVVIASLAVAQGRQSQTNLGTAEPAAGNKSAEDMSNMNPSAMHDMPGMAGEGSGSAMHAMEGHHMDMGAHMRMTSLREIKPGDKEKADQVVDAARRISEKYLDYKVALADGFQIFHPELPQKQYHFTNYLYAFEAAMHFNPDHPTSLLYEKHGDDYKLIGVMYTDRKNAPESELDSRIPLSIAQWHAHINLCVPPQQKKADLATQNPQFGLGGSITTREACDAAGGRFVPQIFGWMVHVYPFEQKPEDIWSVEKQMHNHSD